jgi:cation transport regulator ChaB
MTGKARSLENGGTEVTSVSEVNVVGILAQMGARVINEVSNVIFAQFIKNFQAQLKQSGDATTNEAKPLSAASVAWAAAKGAFHRNS